MSVCIAVVSKRLIYVSKTGDLTECFTFPRLAVYFSYIRCIVDLLCDVWLRSIRRIVITTPLKGFI